MDVAQFLDYMLGSAQAISKTNLETTRIALLDKANKDLRDVIETTLPVVYLVKAYDIANNILVALGKMDEVTISKYVIQIEDPIEGPIGPTEEGFSYAFDEAYSDLVSDLTTKHITTKIIEAISTRLSKEVSLKDLSKEVKHILSVLDTASNAYAISLSLGTPSDTNRITDILHSEIRKAGTDMRTYLNKISPAKFKNPEDFLASFNPKEEILVLGSTFSNITKIVNTVASPIIREWFKTKGIKVSNDLNVGTFTAAGHVAVIDSVKQVIGINTPLTQSTLVYANQIAKKNVTMDTFVLNSTHINCALEVTKNVSAFKGLLSLNFSFLMSQESTFNSVTLKDAEVIAMNSLVAQVFKTTRDKLKQAFLKSIISEKGLDYLTSKLRFSPTLIESISLQVVGPLKGISNTSINAKGIAHKVAKEVSKSVSTSILKKITKLNTSSTSRSTARKPSLRQNLVSLANLQMLINTHLQDVVSANMGNGSSRDILNYRTGRFAASPKVERMSQSREGMITAFYSYMKNPYQVFEPGHKMGSPRTRDPKLLISKSIREIAATKVGNRLRAVLI